MKKLLFILFLVFIPLNAHGAIATPSLLIDATSSLTAGSFTTASFNVTSGSLLIAVCECGTSGTGGVTFNTVTDTFGDVGAWTEWIDRSGATSNSVGLQISTAIVGTGGSGTVTFDPAVSVIRWNVKIYEITSGFNTVTPVAQFASSTGVTSTLTATLASTPATDSMVFAALSNVDTASPIATPGANFTELDESFTTPIGGQDQYDLDNATTACSWSDLSTSNNVGGCIEINAEAVGGDPPVSVVGQWFISGLLSLKGGLRLGGTSAGLLQSFSDLGTFGVVEDFEADSVGDYGVGYISSPSSPASSTLDIIADGDNQYLQVGINDDIANGINHFNSPGSSANLNSIIRFMSPGSNLYSLSPRADILRIKVRVDQGTIGIGVGSAATSLGNSDVLTTVKYLSLGDMDDCTLISGVWYQCDFDLNENLLRTTRRANYSGDTNSPIENSLGEEIIHYTRWVQEGLGLWIVTYDSADNLIISGDPIFGIDDIELVNNNKGRSYPTFNNPVFTSWVNTFESNSNIDDTFTVDFGFGSLAAQPRALLSYGANIGNSGNNSLKIESRSAEEHAWVGISAPSGDSANAVEFEMKLEYGSASIVNHAIDFIALSNPTGSTFDWTGLTNTAGGFDYELSESSTAALNFAVYQTRRIIPRDRWIKVVIPFADFAPAYGSGTMATHHSEQMPLAGDEISVVGLQTGYAARSATTTIYIDSIKYVTVPGTDSQLRSYYQPQVYTP